MRIDRLHMIAYRGLADVELRFRRDARLHIVHGANMSGKSTALAALTDGLYGFPRRGDHTARFAAKDLRIEMEVANEARSLRFRRLKKDKDDLLSADETSLVAHAELEPFLGGVNRTVFEQAFGMSAASLRDGVRAMLGSENDSGGALFAASSGLHGLRTAAERLNEQANGIFAKTKSKNREFYVFAQEHEDAERAERDARLSSSAWKALLAEIVSLEDECGMLREERLAAAREIDRLKQIARLYPLHAEALRIEAALEEFADLQEMPFGRFGELERLAHAAHRAAEAVSEAESALVEAERDLAATQERDPVLEVEDRLAALVREIEHVSNIARKLPEVESGIEDMQARLHTLARSIGLSGAEALDEARPEGGALADLEVAAKDGEDLRLRRQAPIAVLEEADEPDGEGETVDPTPARNLWTALRDGREDAAALAQREAALKADEAQVQRDARRLDPPVTNMDAATAADLPGPAALGRMRQAFAANDAALRDVRALADAHAGERAEAEARRAALLAGSDLVSRDDIVDARRARDLAIEENRSDVADRVRDADVLADRAFERAEDVVAHRDLTRTIERLDERESELRASIERHEAEREALAEKFREAWAPLDVSAHDPEAMQSWRGQFEPLVDRHRDVRQRRLEWEGGRARVAALDGPLRAVLAALGQETGAMPVAALLAYTADALERAEEAWRQAERGRAVAVERDRRRQEARKHLERLDGEEREWRERFSALCAQCGLARDATTDRARFGLDVWNKEADLRDALRKDQARADGMKRDRDAFLARFAEMSERLGETFDQPLEAVALLDKRLASARQRAARHEERREQAERMRVTVERRAEELERAVAERDEQTDRLARSPDEVPEALERLRRRDDLIRKRDEKLDAMRRVPVDWSQDDLAQALDGFDPAANDLALQERQGDLDAIDRTLEERGTDLRLKQRERDAWQAGGGVEHHAFAANAAAARMADTGRDWLVRRAAAHLLQRSVELHAERTSGAFLERVGALLHALTGGAYAGVRQDFTQDEGPRLVVEDGEGTVPISRLSRGATDQLYLALRLAYLEAFSQGNEALPFIGDDIFVEFDAGRTQAGLRTLASMSGSFQTIVFTHHAFVRDLAVEALGDAVDVIEMDAASASRPVEKVTLREGS